MGETVGDGSCDEDGATLLGTPDPATLEAGSGGSDVGETERATVATSVQQQDIQRDIRIFWRAQPLYRVRTSF